MRLVTPSTEWQAAFLEMAAEYEAGGEHRYSSALRDFGAYLQKVEDERRGVNLSEGWVPGTEYWLEHGGKLIGRGKLRHVLNARLEIEGGHIGYDVRPSMRRLGYATELLRLILQKARAIGIERALVTCDDDNIGSIKVIERNGGVQAGTAVSPETGKLVRRYWIEVPA